MLKAWKRPVEAAVKSEFAPVVILLLFSLVVGVLLAPAYGVNWDESADAEYGRYALRAYTGGEVHWDWYHHRKYYGPAYFMAQEWASRELAAVVPTWSQTQARHFVNYLAFQVGVFAFYLICRRLVIQRAAFVGTLLFASQPLLFGHGFINQKDTPFLSAFLLALALGHEAVRRFGSTYRAIPSEAPEPTGPWSAALDLDWRTLSVRSRVVVLAAAAGAAYSFADLVVFRVGLPALLKAGLAQLISDAYRGQAAGWLNDLFARVAEQAANIPVEAYIGKAGRAVDMVLPPGGVAMGLLLLLLVAARFPRSRQRLSMEARAVSLREAYRSGFALLLVASAIAAGLATSIRIIGPLAMVMVALLYVLEHRGRALIPLAVYASLAALTTVLTWPFLWASPASRLVESLVFMANHPKMGYVLYMGEVTKGRLLPWHYLPGLMVLQFTEPVWLLFVVGSAAALGSLVRGRGRLRFLVLLGLWVLTPILPLTLRDRWLYDNFRQFLFVTPPIFLVAALGIEAAFRWLKAAPLRWALALALLAPGLVALFRLHPYQYVYYNSLVGGTRGASHRFELDYWATSYEEAIRRLNGILSPGSVVAFWGTTAGASEHARADLTLARFNSEAELQEIAPQAVVVSTRANSDLQFLPDLPVFMEITADGGVLAIVKLVDPDVFSRLQAH